MQVLQLFFFLFWNYQWNIFDCTLLHQSDVQHIMQSMSCLRLFKGERDDFVLCEVPSPIQLLKENAEIKCGFLWLLFQRVSSTSCSSSGRTRTLWYSSNRQHGLAAFKRQCLTCERGGRQLTWNDLIDKLCIKALQLNPPLPSLCYGALIYAGWPDTLCAKVSA